MDLIPQELWGPLLLGIIFLSWWATLLGRPLLFTFLALMAATVLVAVQVSAQEAFHLMILNFLNLFLILFYTQQRKKRGPFWPWITLPILLFLLTDLEVQTDTVSSSPIALTSNDWGEYLVFFGLSCFALLSFLKAQR